MSEAHPGRPEDLPPGRDRAEGEWSAGRAWAWWWWTLAVIIIGLLIWWIAAASTGPRTTAGRPGADAAQVAGAADTGGSDPHHRDP
jgi:hypothetical protein